MTEPLVKVTQIDDIYLIKFKNNSREDGDAYLDLMLPELAKHIETKGTTQPHMIIQDITDSGIVSLRYAAQKMQRSFAEFEKLPPIYIAYLTNDVKDKVLVEMMNSLTAKKLAHTRRIFPGDGLDEAIAWLKSVRDNF